MLCMYGILLTSISSPDCIGSAFNAKGVMQCPKCRKIEKGNWLYANGSHPSQDPNIDEHDEDFPDVGYSEAARGMFLVREINFLSYGSCYYLMMHQSICFFFSSIASSLSSHLSFVSSYQYVVSCMLDCNSSFGDKRSTCMWCFFPFLVTGT